MPLFSGANVASVSFRYRFILIVISIVFFYSYHSLQKRLNDAISERDSKINICELQTISVSEKLKVVWDHKQKIEQKMRHIEIEFDSNNEKVVEKEAEVVEIKNKNEQCELKLKQLEGKTPSEKEEGEKLLVKKENEEKNSDVEKLSLKNRVAELETLLKTTQMDHQEKMENMKLEIKKLEETIKQTAGGGAVDHYTQNKTANFRRNHKADAPLSFDRGNIQHHAPSRLLHGKELAKTLEEAKRQKAEEENVHPQDRNIKDSEVNEVPNEDEKDYKEH